MINIKIFLRKIFGKLEVAKIPSFPKSRALSDKKRILVLGIYLADRENLVLHLMREFEKAINYIVTQRWVAIADGELPEDYNKYTVRKMKRMPKFKILNELISKEDLEYFDYILISDDDIYLPRGFLDEFIAFQEKFDFALAQPARTRFSYADHRFVLKNYFLLARETDFVEIGPIFCISRVAYNLIFPFDMNSPMGWGYDFVWPVLFQKNNLKIGIIDKTAVAHVIRPQGDAYSRGGELSRMYKFLEKHKIFTVPNGFVVKKLFYKFTLNVFKI